MIRFSIYLSGLLIVYLVFGFFIAQKDFRTIPENLTKGLPHNYFDYKGVTNVHTNLSTGSYSPNIVITAAKNANLDFIFLTDANTLEFSEGLEGYSGNLMVMTAGEFNFLDARVHLYSKKNMELSDLTDAQIKITDLLSQDVQDQKDAFVVLTNTSRASYNWTGEFPTGLSGLEILNPKSISKNAWDYSKASVLWSLLVYPFNPRYAFLRLFREPTEEVALWDQLNMDKKTVGFSGVDANAKSIPFVGYNMNFPSYQRTFEIMSNHVILKSELTGNYQKDREKILQALQAGQFYYSFDLLGDPTGFLVTVEDGEKIHLMGSKIKHNRGLKMKALLPATPKASRRASKDRTGRRVRRASDRSPDCRLRVAPATYTPSCPRSKRQASRRRAWS